MGHKPLPKPIEVNRIKSPSASAVIKPVVNPRWVKPQSAVVQTNTAPKCLNCGAPSNGNLPCKYCGVFPL